MPRLSHIELDVTAAAKLNSELAVAFPWKDTADDCMCLSQLNPSFTLESSPPCGMTLAAE